MKISVVIPGHNEQDIIPKTISLTYNTLEKTKYDFEIVIVDDNSNDNSPKVLDVIAKKNKKVKILHKKSSVIGPTGLGSALVFGFKKCTGDVVIPLMGDMSDDPKEIPRFIKKIEEGNDVVAGSRFIHGAKLTGYPTTKMIVNRVYNRIFAILFLMKVTDISNAFKAYRKEVIQLANPKSKGFEITSEIVLKARVAGMKIDEVPVTWSSRKDESKGSKFGSFKSLKFIFIKLPQIGYNYGMLSLKLWIQFLLKGVGRKPKF